MKKHKCYIEQVSDGWIEFECKKNTQSWYGISPAEQDKDLTAFIHEGIKVLNKFCKRKHKVAGQ